MKPFICVLLVFIFFKNAALVDITCNDLLITDFSQKTCVDLEFENTTYFYKVNTQNCLPYCEKYKYDGKLCDKK